MADSSSKHLINTQPLSESSLYCCSMKPEVVGPVLQNHSHSVMLKGDISSGVSGLARLCCPFAIIWGIVARIIQAINGVFCTRSLSHVGKEADKAICSKPLVTNLYAATAIVVVVLIAAVITALFHSPPDAILGASALAVGCSSLGRGLAKKASTTAGAASHQTMRQNVFLITTLAQAAAVIHATLGILYSHHADNGQAAKGATGIINGFHKSDPLYFGVYYHA